MANESKNSKEEIREIALEITKNLTAEGKLIEGGFMAFKIIVMPPNVPDYQVRDMRLAFFAGAEHLFSSILAIMDSDREPTAADEKKMDLINAELAKFRADMAMLFAASSKSGQA